MFEIRSMRVWQIVPASCRFRKPVNKPDAVSDRDAIDRVTVGDGVGLVDRFPKTAGGGDDLPNAHAADFEHSFPAESSLDAPAGG